MFYHNSFFWALKFLVAVVSVVNCDDVAKSFAEHDVVPNVIAIAPKQELKVNYVLTHCGSLLSSN